MNCIPVKPFEFTANKSENDEFLKDLIPVLNDMSKEQVIGKTNLKEYLKNRL